MPTLTNKMTGAANAIEGFAVGGRGVHGASKSGIGVVGESDANEGVHGRSHGQLAAVIGFNDGPAPGGHGGWFESAHGEGIRATAHTGFAAVAGVNDAPAPGGPAGWFESNRGEGVRATVHGQVGAIVGINDADAPDPPGPAAWFESTSGEAVHGVSHGGDAAVVGINDSAPPGGNGGWFESAHAEGVRGTSSSPNHAGVAGLNEKQFGVYGWSKESVGIWGVSVGGEGVHAETDSTSVAALAAIQKNKDSGTAALYARHDGFRTAAFFEGSIVVTGDISLANADCAEDFDVAPDCPGEPGTVMVLDGESALRESGEAYDRRVVGVVSGAGSLKPALLLDRQPPQRHRRPIALLGKVFCKADAEFGPIAVGDLLTTSPTPGHAMRVGDPARAAGAVIGKAMRPLADGRGLIPILIALQ